MTYRWKWKFDYVPMPQRLNTFVLLTVVSPFIATLAVASTNSVWIWMYSNMRMRQLEIRQAVWKNIILEHNGGHCKASNPKNMPRCLRVCMKRYKTCLEYVSASSYYTIRCSVAVPQRAETWLGLWLEYICACNLSLSLLLSLPLPLYVQIY